MSVSDTARIATLASRIAAAQVAPLPAAATAHLAILTAGAHAKKNDRHALAGSIDSFLAHCAPGIASEDRTTLRVIASRAGW